MGSHNLHSQKKQKSTTDPEYVIDEETSEEDAASADAVQWQQFHTIDGKRQAKQVVGHPVLQQSMRTDMICQKRTNTVLKLCKYNNIIT